MNVFERILLILVSLVGIAAGLTLISIWYPVPFVSAFIVSTLIQAMWFRITMIVFLVVVIAAFIGLLLVAIFAPTSARFVKLRNEQGNLKISKRAIEGIARSSTRDLTQNSPVVYKAKLRKHSEKIKLNTKIYLKNKDEAVTLGETIQSRIKDKMALATGISNIDVKVKILEPSQKTIKHESKVV